jgi:aspartyl-tRNA(Asn)/glutamyl-tRNA(Gln) amidotransferase subunit A
MTRTAEDAALLLDVVSGADPRDPWAGVPASSAVAGLTTRVPGLRVAVSATLGYVDVDPRVAAAFEAAVDVVAALGARVEEVDPGFADPIAAFETLWFAGAATSLAAQPAHVQARMDRGLVDVAAEGARTTAVAYLRAMAMRNELGVRMGALHERYDLLLTPTLPLPAFAAGVEVPPGWPRERWTSWTPFTYPFNITQQPAASVPCGLVDGLPVGLQIVGPRHADERVLALGNAFQQATDWHRLRPPLLG